MNISFKNRGFTVLLLIALLFSQLFSNLTVSAENASSENNYKLSFDISRSQFSNFENLSATYSNHWMGEAENEIFDKEEWVLKDFSVEYELHIETENTAVTQNMTYTAASFSWDDKVSFQNIEIPFENVEIEYYSTAGNQWVEPYLLHYDLYLTKEEGKMVLKVPKLQPSRDDLVLNGDEKILEVENFKVIPLNPEIKTIYLNGQSGEDSQDGTSPDKAVKSFDKAKELAESNQNIREIIVIGTTEIENNISLAGTNATLIRGENFNGFLFRVASGKEASLADIVIDGNSSKNPNIEKSLIEVKSHATLNITSGAVLSNNQLKDIKNTATKGGAIIAQSATINMTGGLVENNQATYGGGICLNASTMNFTGGSIHKNNSRLVIDTSYSQFYSAGGGILVDDGSTLNMSKDAKVLNNTAKEIGGGISLGSDQWGPTNILNMTGGTIDGNIAGSSGGGIFVQAKYFSGGASKAYISEGIITNNHMDATGRTNKAFGGGGIYVNGANNQSGVQGANGELYLKNALITDNKADLQGGGFAGCPISKTKIYVNNGVAIYDNQAQNGGNDLYILASDYYGLHSGIPEYELSKRMLGGALYNWTMEDGSPLPEEKHKGKLQANSSLTLHSESKGNDLTKDLAKVIIAGNTSETRGGGIGSNGTIIIGTEDENTEVSVEKKWEDNNNKIQSRPSSISVELVANDQYIVETKKLNEENNWKHTFRNLPTIIDGKKISYTIKELDVDGYNSKISGNSTDGFVITNTKEMPILDLKVTKEWLTDREAAMPQSKIKDINIIVELYRDGESTGKTAKLNIANKWTASFEKLPVSKALGSKPYIYTIKEKGLSPNNEITINGLTYKSEVNGNQKDGFTITNKLINPKISVSGEKRWKDKENQDGIRPEKITVHLYANDMLTDNSLEVSKDTNWKYSFDNLPSYDKNGDKISYTVKEDKVKDYSSEISEAKTDNLGNIIYDITNRHEPIERTIKLNKQWIDDNNKKELRPKEIKVKLIADGDLKNPVKEITIKEADNGKWEAEFKNLPVNKKGKEIKYTIIEEKVKNYKEAVKGTMEEGFTLTNTLEITNREIPKPKSPNTSNPNNLFTYLMLFTASLSSLTILLKRRIVTK